MSKPESGIPTISRVADDTLIELAYDSSSRKTSLIVSRFGGLWNAESEVKIGSEILVPYSAANNLIANECVQLPSLPVDYGQKDELIADIRAFLNRYVDLSPTFELIAAYYVLLTWVYDRFNEVPYLRIRGEYGTGKTRALIAIGSLCNKAFFASGASTTSPIFHTQDAFGGTLVLDEADLPYSDARADVVKRPAPHRRGTHIRHWCPRPISVLSYGNRTHDSREGVGAAYALVGYGAMATQPQSTAQASDRPCWS
jgi:hypothetical protein